jgi:integrase
MVDGVFIARTKGSWNEVTLWSPRLRNAIDAQLAIRNRIIDWLLEKGKPVPKNDYLFITLQGEPLNKKNALDTAWQRIKRKLLDSGAMPDDDRFTFHDIKACGVTNHPLNESGHKTEQAKKRYLRGTKRVSATE